MRAAVVFLLLYAAGANASEYEGRYAMSDHSVVIFRARGGVLAFKPIFWTSLQSIRATGNDSFVVTDRPDREVHFLRGADGRVNAVRISGIGDDARMPRIEGKLTPVELLFDHKPKAAGREIADESTAIDFADRLTARFPSRTDDAVAFLEVIAKRWPGNQKLHRVFGDALIAVHRRREARKQYELAGSDPDARRALRMLSGDDLAGLFRDPTRSEKIAVLADWARRDLSPRDIEVVATKGTMRIISHRVLGSKHYTAIIVPKNAKPGCCPVVVDAKGVSWDYFARNLDQPIDSIELTGDDASRFVFVIPSFRGEVMTLDGVRYVSEGDRANVWDGATDDALAALNIALHVVPEADAKSICTFGRSRGGTVALLAAIRDPRIRCVVAWAAPTEHFRLMGQGGWTQRETVAEGVREHSAPNGIGGQFIETFLGLSLEESRLRLIASSPLYFASRLPRVQLHYGVDDPVVPVINGEALKSAAPHVEAFFYKGFGHDTDKIDAYKHSRQFFLRMLKPAAASAETK